MELDSCMGRCPHCRGLFDARQSKLAFPGKITGKKITFIFALCPQCYCEFNMSDDKQKIDIIKITYLNVVKQQSDEWTVRSSLALNNYWGYFFSTWWHGVGLPRPLFDAINDGFIDEVTLFPPNLGGANE